jgi:hypothetical protein
MAAARTAAAAVLLTFALCCGKQHRELCKELKICHIYLFASPTEAFSTHS